MPAYTNYTLKIHFNGCGASLSPATRLKGITFPCRAHGPRKLKQKQHEQNYSGGGSLLIKTDGQLRGLRKSFAKRSGR